MDATGGMSPTVPARQKRTIPQQGQLETGFTHDASMPDPPSHSERTGNGGVDGAEGGRRADCDSTADREKQDAKSRFKCHEIQ